MGSCLSKTKRGANTLESVPEGQLQRPSNQHRRSITYIKPRAPCDNEESLKRFNVMEEAEELELGGLKIRYGYMSQRGYYPGDENKPNQDAFSISKNFATQKADAFFAVYDGHGRDGDKCAQFAKKNLPRQIQKYVRKIKSAQFEDIKKKALAKDTDLSGIDASDVELNKEQIQFACTNGHLLVNEAMHHNDNFEDALSGTTAISAFVQGRRNRITISNVGDSRAILGKRIEKPIEGATAADGTSNPVVYRAQSLSHDQTPYRKSERKRIRECGARILSLDQIEGLEPVGPDDDYGDDFDPGEQIDEDGDPPRVWHPDMDYPGTAFTRSLGDSLAEDLGVIAEPEIVTRELEEGDEIIVLASDGVFEFLTNQSVIDICAKFVDPVEACQAVISEAYELWLQYELRTDDITMICIFIDGIEKDSDDLRTSIARQSIKDLHKDVPDNFAMDTLPTKSDSNKMNKRLTEMKQLLEESLLDTPNEGQKFDIRKTFNEKTAEEKERLSQVVKGSVMLQSMTPEQLDLIYGLMQPVDVSEGEWVIRQGEDGERFYIVDEGKFEVRISSEPAGRGPVTGDGGKVVHVYEGSIEKKLHPSFGELALLYSAPRAASIVAQTDGKLWALDRAALKSVMLDNAEKKGLVSILRSIEELGKFKDEEIEDFASVMQEVSFNPGSMITTTEKAGTALYILSKGTCKIALENEDESMSSILQKLDYFGQETIVEGRYLATVEALTDVKCWKLEKDAIEYSMKKLQAVREGRSTLE